MPSSRRLFCASCSSNLAKFKHETALAKNGPAGQGGTWTWLFSAGFSSNQQQAQASVKVSETGKGGGGGLGNIVVSRRLLVKQKPKAIEKKTIGRSVDPTLTSIYRPSQTPTLDSIVATGQ